MSEPTIEEKRKIVMEWFKTTDGKKERERIDAEIINRKFEEVRNASIRVLRRNHE